MSRIIKKIKYDGDQVTLAYEIPRENGDPDSGLITSGDAPDLPFVDALKAIRKHIAGILGWTVAYCEDIYVRSVSFSWAHGRMSAIISATKPLGAMAFNFNTPLVKSKAKSDDGATDSADVAQATMPDELIADLEALLVEADKYLDGERRQLSLLEAA